MAEAHVVIVGGGVVGASIAHYVARQGYAVTVVERDDIGGACSYGNAGLIVPSYVVPISTLTSLRRGILWLFNPRAPFVIKPRLERELIGWLKRFVVACRPAAVAQRIPVLARLTAASMRLYEELVALDSADFGFERRGWLYVFRDQRALTEGLQTARLVAANGIRWELLRSDRLHDLHPSLRSDLAGGIFYPDDAHLDPRGFLAFLRDLPEREKVEFITQRRVVRLSSSNNRIDAAVTDAGDVKGDVFVLAAGAWTTGLLGSVGLRLPMQPATGYSLTFPASASSPTIPLKLAEAQVVLTPIRSQMRLTGGLELAGFTGSTKARRLGVIRSAPGQYLTAFDARFNAEAWFGYRPMTPDGLPIVGPTQRFRNLIVATGHGTLGMTLAPVTGKLIADYLSNTKSREQLEPISPARFGL